MSNNKLNARDKRNMGVGMRLNGWLFILVVLAVGVFAAANWSTLFRVGRVNLFFLGEYVLPTRLVGLLSLLLAAAFTLLANLQDVQARARSAGYLKRIEELRISLGHQEASRFAALQNQIASATRQILEEIQ